MSNPWPPPPATRNTRVSSIASYLSSLDSSSKASKLILAMRFEENCYRNSSTWEEYEGVINKKLNKAKSAASKSPPNVPAPKKTASPKPLVERPKSPDPATADMEVDPPLPYFSLTPPLPPPLPSLPLSLPSDYVPHVSPTGALLLTHSDEGGRTHSVDVQVNAGVIVWRDVGNRVTKEGKALPLPTSPPPPTPQCFQTILSPTPDYLPLPSSSSSSSSGYANTLDVNPTVSVKMTMYLRQHGVQNFIDEWCRWIEGDKRGETL